MGQRIDGLLLLKGISRKDFAESLDITRQYLDAVLRDDRRPPLETLLDWATRLKCTDAERHHLEMLWGVAANPQARDAVEYLLEDLKRERLLCKSKLDRIRGLVDNIDGNLDDEPTDEITAALRDKPRRGRPPSGDHDDTTTTTERRNKTRGDTSDHKKKD